jgi:hypothetical protein
MQNTSAWLGVGIIVAVLIAGAIFFLRPHMAGAPVNSVPQATSSSQGSTTVIDLGGGVAVQTTGGVTVTPVPDVQAPNLDHKVAYASDLPADVKTAFQSQISAVVAMLKKDPSQFAYWLQLAIDYKVAGDYTAAANVWGYLTKVAPESYVPYADLGDLYQNFLKDYPKAEANYLQAIKLSPQDIDLYIQLYTMYRYEYKTNTSAAANILAQGLKANPGNQTLLALQQQLQGGSQ